MILLKKLKQTLAVGQVWPIGIAATEFRLTDAFWPVSVAVYRLGQVVGEFDNVQAGDYFRDIDFDRVEITSAIAQDVTVTLSSGGTGSDRITGEVSVIDGGKSRTLAGEAFSVPGYQAAVAASMPTVQIWNAAGSGKNVVLESMSFSSSVAQIVRAGWNTAAVAAAAASTSKLAGGAAGVAGIAAAALAGIPVGFVYNGQFQVPASVSQIINFREPVILPPGYGFCLQGNAANTDLSGNFEYFEEVGY